MHPVKTAQRTSCHLGSATQKDERLLPNQRHRSGDLTTHRGGPEGPLIPRQQVAGKAEAQSHRQQEHTHRPGDLARRFISALEKDAQQMEHAENDHQVGTPGVDAADKPAKVHFIHNEQDTVVGCIWGRLVVEREQNTGNDLDHEEKEGDSSQIIGADRARNFHMKQGPHQRAQSITFVQPVPDTPDN